MSRFRSLSVVLCLVLAGCVTATNPADYGPNPDNYESIVKDWLHAHRPNVETMRDLTMTKPVQDRVWVGNLYGGFMYGYKTCVTYDIKNNYGQYTGPKNYSFLLKDGAVAHAGPYELINDGC